MRRLSEKHRHILILLSTHIQGLTLTQIAKEMNSTKPNISDAIKRLLTKGFIRRESKGTFKLIHLTQSGKEQLKLLESGSVVASKPLTDSSSQKGKPIQTPHQRAHALQAQARLYRTSYDQAERIMDYLKIPYSKIGIKPSQYKVEWKGIKLKITTHKLIAYGKEIVAPLEIDGERIRDAALTEMGGIMEDFLERTNLRCQRDLANNLLVSLKNWEIAFTDNELARKATEKGGLVVLAYDRKNGNATIYADNSFSSELEVKNSPKPHAELRRWGQAIQDGLIRPYDDEIRTRESISRLEQIQQTNTQQIAEYARQIELHLKVMKKIDQKLSQKRLFE